MVDRREAIKSAFLDSLRTVVMIDDQFPSYEELCNGKPEHRKEADRAQSLWTGFREHGLACEVENDVPKLLQDPKRPEYILKCDLIVLDYHLSDTNDEGKAARGLLRKLLENGQPHLVVIYTAHDKLNDVQLQIAATLMGRPTEHFPSWRPDQEEEEDQYKELQERQLVSDSDFIEYLQRKDIKSLNFAKDLGKQHGSKARLWAERLLHDKAVQYDAPYDSSSKRLLQISNASAGPWLRCDNLFVSIVKKNKDAQPQSGEAAFLQNSLLEALVDWNPSFLRIVFNYARRRVVAQGFLGDDRVLKTPNHEAGWHYYMASGTPEERNERVAALYSRLFEDLIIRVRGELEDFSEKFSEGFSVGASTNAMMNARARAAVPDTESDEDILHALNEYLAFEEQLPHYIRTGTIFLLPGYTDQAGICCITEDTEAGICITPDCDLVPRKVDSGWPKRLGAHKAVLFRPVTLSKDFKEALKEAEQGRALFRCHEGLKVLQLSSSNAPPRKPEIIFVENLGRIERADKTFRAKRITENDGKLSLRDEKPFRVIGQLRDRYALRLLHEAGHYLSRIGVDFVNLP